MAPQVYAKVEGWRTSEVHRLTEQCVDICNLLSQYAKEYSIGHVHAIKPTGKLRIYIHLYILYYLFTYLRLVHISFLLLSSLSHIGQVNSLWG